MAPKCSLHSILSLILVVLIHHIKLLLHLWSSVKGTAVKEFKETPRISFPSIALIDQGSVPLTKGTKVYLNYFQPLEASEQEYLTLVTATTISDMAKRFEWGTKPWACPVSCAVQTNQSAQDLAIISRIISENPAAFESTSIHLIISEETTAPQWVTLWNIALKAARTELVMTLPEPTPFLMEHFTTVSRNIKEHYLDVLKVQKYALHIEGTGESEALVLSRRAGLLPILTEDVKTKDGFIRAWIVQLQKYGFHANRMNWHVLRSYEARVRSEARSSELFEMGNMLVAGLNVTIEGSIMLERGLWAFTNFISPKVKPKEEVTLVTQMSFNKRERLVKLASSWRGVMSTAVFLTIGEIEELVRFVRNNLMVFSKVSFHVVIFSAEYDDLYPVNHLRNVATDASKTDFILTDDVDFVASFQARDVISSYLSHSLWGKQLRDTRVAFIIPAFEYTKSNLQDDADLFAALPLSKDELLLSNKSAVPFHANFHAAGHRATDFDRWYTADEPYEVRYEKGFEPYILLCTTCHSAVPRYWESFKGFRLNKASWIRELFLAGYRFYVMPGESFLIHMHHNIRHRTSMDSLFSEEKIFEEYLEERYMYS